MSNSKLFLVTTFLVAVPALPIDAIAQVNLRRYPVQRSDGETLRMDRTEAFQSGQRQRRAIERLRGEDRARDQRERELEYATDACGFGCEGHEGLRVRKIPDTRLSAVLYKTHLDDGVLTVQLRFHNDGPLLERLTLDPSGPLHVQVGEERLCPLVDEDGELEAKHPLDVELDPGEMESWWARFPAPPSGATTFDLHIPGATFRDVPLATD